MSAKSYTFIVASGHNGGVRKVRIPAYVFHVLVTLMVVGALTVLAAGASYSRLLWKAANYNAAVDQQAKLERRVEQLQTMVTETNQRFSSLQSLATEVAMSYGVIRFPQTPFALTHAPAETEAAYLQSVDQFSFLADNARFVALASQWPNASPAWRFGMALEHASFAPSVWPVVGHLSGGFGERMDPFTGEGGFHRGVDISAAYGSPVRAAADGLVTAVERRSGYGRLVVVDHGFGVTTWYGHLSGFNTHPGTRIKRGEVVGFVGVSGRSTAPHVHYEVRIDGTPINPWRYLRNSMAD